MPNQPPNRCVFTTLIGRYERLNEQPMAAQSSLPFICLTDDPDLKSDSWEIRLVSPVFGMDPIRSQRDLKIRPHVHLPEFIASLYIDNTVLLTSPPEVLFEQYLSATGFSIPQHSFRESTLDEFVEVARLGLDDQARIFEQLNHYTLDYPEVLQERPYWAAILLREHHNPKVRALMEVWASHVQRYSRRDQLSLSAAIRQAGLTPDVIQIDNHASWFHSWPHAPERDRHRGMRRPIVSLSPPNVRIRELEQTLADQIRLVEQARITEQALLESRKWRFASALSQCTERYPHLSRWGWRTLKLASWAVRGQLPHQLKQVLAARKQARAEVVKAPLPPEQKPTSVDVAKGRMYINPLDERGLHLVQQHGNLNPRSLQIWRSLVSAGQWTHIVDVGANYGEMLIGVEMPPGAKVIAVEPSPQVLPYLERTLREAGIDAELVRVAVAEQVGSAQLLLDNRWSGRTRLAAEDAAFESLVVPTTTLAKLLGDAGAGAGARVLVKIDVEGQDAAVLKTIPSLLERLEKFEALVEILHLDTESLDWLFEHFELHLLRLNDGELVRITPGASAQLATLVASGHFYPQDAVVRPKGV